MLNERKPILVTGSHRSGSTWVGRMLALEPSVEYIFEPFSPFHDPSVCGARFDYWFTYVCTKNEADYLPYLRKTLGFRYNLIKKLKTSRAPRAIMEAIRAYIRSLQNRVSNRRPLMKDPIAIFSAEWLEETFDMDVVVLIRHPAAFAGSLKVQNWTHSFDHFLKQPFLMRDMLDSYKCEIEEYSTHQAVDIVDQAALLWRIIYGTVLKYKQNHPDWIFLRHEDLSLDPSNGFKQLYKRLDLEMTDSILEAILSHSRSNENTRIKRNSMQNVLKWKERLTTKEVERVWENVKDISTQFYSTEEW